MNPALRVGNMPLRLAIIVFLVFTWADFGVRVVLPVFSAPHWPNPAYWVAGRLAAEGKADLIYADRDVFFAESARLGTVPDIFEANMPTTILVFLPLQGLSETNAYIVWDMLMILCFLAACALLLKVFSLPTNLSLLVWALLPLFHPWRENISRGQAYPLLLLLLVLGAVLGYRPLRMDTGFLGNMRERSRWLAGLAFGLIAIVKLYYSAAFLLPALISRRVRTLAGAVAVFGAAALVTIALWGAGLWLSPIQYAISWRDRPETAVTAYQTLNSLLTHLLRYDATWNRGPVADQPQLVVWLWWPLALLILTSTVLILWRVRNSASAISRRAGAMLPLALVVPVALVLAPVAEDYHFVLALFSLMVFGVILWDMYTTSSSRVGHHSWVIPGGLSTSRRSSFWFLVGLLVVAALLLGAPWRFNVPSVGGWHSLLYYPRLYGSILLWLLMGVLLLTVPRPPNTTIKRLPDPD